MFGFGLFDLLFATASIAIGAVLGRFLSADFPVHFQSIAGPFSAICVYFALVYPVYRGLGLRPMVHPRCPCCGDFQQGFHILGGRWPRISIRCPACNGEFVVWFNGKPQRSRETWENPVLALKWPYALGRYKRMQRPDKDTAPNSSPVTPGRSSGETDRSPSES